MRLHSNFALLDVMHGRKQLAKHLPPASQQAPRKARVPVTITGYITHAHGDDDGTSIEFGVSVETVTVDQSWWKWWNRRGKKQV